MIRTYAELRTALAGSQDNGALSVNVSFLRDLLDDASYGNESDEYDDDDDDGDDGDDALDEGELYDDALDEGDIVDDEDE